MLNAWCMYDWANSVHALVIVSSIFPIYFSNTAVNAQGGEIVEFLGFNIKNSALFSLTVSAAFLLIAFLSPVFGAIADYSGRKKLFMKGFVYLGSVCCLLLYFFNRDHLYLGVFAFMFSLIGWSGSIVFYNAYLPEIATEDRFDKLSARGFTMGYIGSVLLLIFNLTMLTMPQWYGGISSGTACKISFLTVGIWWLGFAQIPFHYLEDKKVSNGERNKDWIWNGFKELKKVFAQLKQIPILKRFLLAFFFYNMGAQTVMYLGTIFGSSELHLPDNSLIVTILLLQILAIFGAYVFANLSAKLGNTKALMLIAGVWVVICICAYFVYTEIEFYVLASAIGLVMGGIQSLSRSTYAKLLPEETTDTASYFSFYDVTDKISTFLGTSIFGLVDQAFGMRNSILVLVLVFFAGVLMLSKIPSQKTYKVVLPA
ncbi:MFS transporter [Pseudarcicella hirudinis]|uniref:MFS transporter n=1 Tax=Pseudarcicella hirudinis TaxID=1079859 RepID=UPI0035EBCFB8